MQRDRRDRTSFALTALAVLCVTTATPLQANDSTAETRAGGLVLVRNADIDMAEEDLFISAEQIRVRYVFRNRARADRTVTVAFPMPDHDLSAEQDGDVGFPSDFATRVDGRPVRMQVERKAMLGAADHTPLLARLAVPVSPGADQAENRIVRALDALPRAEQDRLVRLRLAAVEEYDAGRGTERHLAPLWIVRETWHWEQTFPAGRDLIVDHQYKPGTGGSVGALLAFPEFRREAEGRAMIRDYCVDRAFLAGVDRLVRQAGPERTVQDRRVGYVLTTGGNWRSPIGRFRLVVDKGAPENLVSFCGEGVRRISPTQFEMVRTNWRPDRDLQVLIVLPQPVG